MLARQRLDLAPQVDVGPGKRRIIVAPRGDRRSQPPDAFDSRRGDRDPQFGGLALQRVEPGRIARAFLEQSVAAAQRALELIDPRAVLWIDRQHETIEKAPSLARRAGEQTVHRRGQPDQPDMVGEGARRSDRRPVDAIEPFGRRFAARRLHPDAEMSALSLLLDLERYGEAAGAADPRAGGEVGAPQAASGRE